MNVVLNYCILRSFSDYFLLVHTDATKGLINLVSLLNSLITYSIFVCLDQLTFSMCKIMPSSNHHKPASFWYLQFSCYIVLASISHKCPLSLEIVHIPYLLSILFYKCQLGWVKKCSNHLSLFVFLFYLLLKRFAKVLNYD